MGGNLTATVTPPITPSYAKRVTAAVLEAFEASGLTKDELAERVKADISRSTLQRRLAGAPFVTDEIEVVAAALGVPPEQLGAPGRAA